MGAQGSVTVYGAYGHTGRFVVEELARRGWSPVLAGRDRARLEKLAAEHPGAEVRPADVESPTALDAAVAGSRAVVNCAGPFAATARPVLDAALRAGVPYLDVAAEIEAILDTFAHADAPARAAGLPVVPAMAFFGGLGDLLATAALPEGATAADEVAIAYGLSSWAPTEGTRAAGRVSRERRGGKRVVHTGGKLTYLDDPAPTGEVEWEFPGPLGRQPVLAELTMADSVTIPRHVTTPEVRSYMTAVAVRDLVNPERVRPDRDPDQAFVVDVVVRVGGEERRAAAAGHDIYGSSAPLVVEGLERVLDGRLRAGAATSGVLTAGQAFDAADLLAALPLDVTLPPGG
ncbi:MAG TPA: saccharopine dehydrogenase NADP-binding domain-containing protein [Acidimicrobiales bacterium]